MTSHDGQGGTDFTRGSWRFNIVYLRGQRRLQLWLRGDDYATWEFGHGKTIPEGMTVEQAVAVMQAYVFGAMDHDTYNLTLPGK